MHRAGHEKRAISTRQFFELFVTAAVRNARGDVAVRYVEMAATASKGQSTLDALITAFSCD